METKNTYVRELHSFFEGLTFIWIILCGLAFKLVSFLNLHAFQAKDHVDLYSISLIIAFVIIYGLLAYFSKIRSFAVECAVAAWVFYIIALVEVGNALPGKQMEFFGNTGLALAFGVIIATAFFALIGLQYLALRKSKIYDEQAIMHTWYYKFYRFLRGAVFVAVLLLLILYGLFYFSPEYYYVQKLIAALKDNESAAADYSYQILKESLLRQMIHLGSIGAILMVLGYFTSVFALGIELLVTGFILLFLTLAPIIIYFIGPFSLMNGIMYIMVIPILYMALIALFCIVFKKYRKKHHV